MDPLYVPNISRLCSSPAISKILSQINDDVSHYSETSKVVAVNHGKMAHHLASALISRYRHQSVLLLANKRFEVEKTRSSLIKFYTIRQIFNSPATNRPGLLSSYKGETIYLYIYTNMYLYIGIKSFIFTFISKLCTFLYSEFTPNTFYV